MAGSATRRRLATVLFVDIVGSTALASRIGDSRWRDVLGRFQRVARAEVRRHDGHTEDTAGDGLLATFTDPVAAIETASSTIVAARALGLNVRAGLHTGSCAEVDGKLQGIAVNIGARVTALAGSAEILTTATVRDLVIGSGFAFSARGEHQLRGVEGTWPVFAVSEPGEPKPEALTLDASQSIVESLDGARRPLYRRPLVVAGVAFATAAAVAAALIAFSRGTSSRPISLVRIDARGTRVSGVVHDRTVGNGRWENLWVTAGTLWQLVGTDRTAMVQRNIVNGRPVRSLSLGGNLCTCRVAIGFGSIWVAQALPVANGGFGAARTDIVRIDQLSARRSAISVLGTPEAIRIGGRAVWLLEQDASLIRIDPLRNEVTARYRPLGLNVDIFRLFSTPGYEWLVDENFGGSLTRVDSLTGRSKSFSIPLRAEVVEGALSPGPTVWVLDPDGGTVAQMDISSGRVDVPVGLDGSPLQAVAAFGAVWVAAGRVVDRVDARSQNRTVITMPRGVWAGSIAADPRTSAIWVGNSVGPRASPLQ